MVTLYNYKFILADHKTIKYIYGLEARTQATFKNGFFLGVKYVIYLD